jgi:hypothetical protein
MVLKNHGIKADEIWDNNADNVKLNIDVVVKKPVFEKTGNTIIINALVTLDYYYEVADRLDECGLEWIDMVDILLPDSLI